MGTRAQFFINNPQDVEIRQWLGCVAFDGYPDGDIGCELRGVTSEELFRACIRSIQSQREDFCDPSKHGFPFPWTDDLFLTDYTYAWFDGKVMMTSFHRRWIGLEEYLDDQTVRDKYHDEDQDRLPSDVPAPTAEWDRSAPDSIMIISTR